MSIPMFWHAASPKMAFSSDFDPRNHHQCIEKSCRERLFRHQRSTVDLIDTDHLLGCSSGPLDGTNGPLLPHLSLENCDRDRVSYNTC